MASSDAPSLPPPHPEHRRVAAGQFERANQVIATGNYDYGIQLLLNCCQLDPANLIFRQTLRHTEKVKYSNNLRGSRLAFLTTAAARARVKRAGRAGKPLKVLEHGERVLTRNPWDAGAQMDMARAAEALGLLDLAVWFVEQVRLRDPRDPSVNRSLARLYERRGNFTQAIALWELVRNADPRDNEARQKGKDLAANATIARGGYESLVADSGKPAAEPRKDRADKPANAIPERLAQEATLKAKIDADPTSANAYLHLAGIYRRAGQLDQARALLQQGLGPTGNHFELAAELAELEVEPFRHNLGVVEEKLKRQPDDAELRTLRIRLLKEINARELELFRQKSERYPTDKAARFELGLRLLRAGQVDEAIRELQVVRNDPRHHWKALFYLGSCFKSRNNWRLAQRNYEEALQNLPSGEDATRKELLFQLARGTADSGDLAKAVDFACELANLDFGYNDIGRLLDEWQTRLQQEKVSG